jgi:plastocyanin domain-containing protein
MIDKIVVTTLGGLIIGFIIWYFFMIPDKGSKSN